MDKIEKLRLTVYTKYLDGLSIYRYLDTTEFYVACSLANSEQIKQLEAIVGLLNINGVTNWVKNIFIENNKYDHLDVRSLRQICSDLGIKNYIKYNRTELINVLNQIKEEKNEKENSNSNRN